MIPTGRSLYICWGKIEKIFCQLVNWAWYRLVKSSWIKKLSGENNQNFDRNTDRKIIRYGSDAAAILSPTYFQILTCFLQKVFDIRGCH